MEIKKGMAWLRRDFEDQLGKALTENHTVNLDKLINFPGRDIVIENMISRKDLDRARYDDLQIQRKIEEKRMAETTIRCNLKNKLKEEEAALRAAMGV
jgi:hypothetical protein